MVQSLRMMEEWTDSLLDEGVWQQALLLALIGACIGSFLNVVLYRLPRGMSVNNPRRSFCPTCHAPIPWRFNLPIISWLILRGRSACCRKPISPRYFIVELVCFLMFGSVALFFDYEPLIARLLISLWGAGMLAILIMDWEYMVVFRRLVFAAAGCGLAAAVLSPMLVGAGTLDAWEGLLWGCVGILAGYVIFRVVALVGKLMLGRREFRFSEPTRWELCQIGDNLDIELTAGGHSLRWTMIFADSHSTLTLQNAQVDQMPGDSCTVQFTPTHMIIGESSYSLEDFDSLSGTCCAVSSKHAAMGLGDAWIAMAIGSVCGWQGVVFSLVIGSLLSIFLALVLRVHRGEPMPFGPPLVMASYLWLVAGPQLLEWYFGLLS